MFPVTIVCNGPLAAAGFAMLAPLKEQTQLSWRQLFVQRARALKPRAPEPEPQRAIKREDFLIGVEGRLQAPRLGSRPAS